MFTMYITYSAKNNDMIRAFYEEVKKAGIIEKTRAESGNIKYEYYFSAERENEIFLFEQWQNKDAQKTHDNLPHIVLLMELKKEFDIVTSVEEG